MQCQECHTAEAGRLDFAALGYSVADVTKLTTFPPADPTPEPTAAPAMIEKSAPVEENPAEPAPTQAPASLSGNATLWIAVIVVIVLVAVSYFAMRGNKKEV